MLKGFRDKVAEKALHHCLKRAKKGSSGVQISSYLHKALNNDPERFQTALQRILLEEGWESAKPLLQILQKTPLYDWIPTNLLPPLLFLDIESRPWNKTIAEIALLLSPGLLEEPLLYHKEDKEKKGLDPQEIEDLFQQVLTKEKKPWLLGHHCKEFDLPLLKEHQIHLPDLPILDTLELSLITYPLQSKQALSGDHTAKGDVEKNLELFKTLDAKWLTIEKEELEWHIYWNQRERGFSSYLSWVALRRGLNIENPKRRKSLKSFTPTPDTTFKRESISSSTKELLHEIERETGSKGLILSRSSTPHDSEGLYRWARENQVVIALPYNILKEYRVLQRKKGSLIAKGTWIYNDSLLHEDYLFEILKNGENKGEGWSFLFRWWFQGGRYRHEIHPSASRWMSLLNEKKCFVPIQEREEDTFLIDHAAFLQETSSYLAHILDTEHLIDATIEAFGKTIRIREPSRELQKIVKKFLSHRVLPGSAHLRSYQSTELDSHDTEDPLFKELLLICKTQEEEAIPLLEKASHPEYLTLLQALSHEEAIKEIQIKSIPKDHKERLKAKLKDMHPQTRLLAGPVHHTLLGDQLEELTGITFHPIDVDPSKKPGLLVIEDGTLGTPFGLPRALQTALKYILYSVVHKTQEDVPSLLAFSPPLQRLLVRVLRRAAVPAHSAERFGHRSTTVDRLADHERGVFVADSRPLPLPSFVHSVLLYRLPFPSRFDPLVRLEIGALDPSKDGFQEVILPRMLKSLWQSTGLLRSYQIKVISMDHRAIIHTSYRGHIEALLGPIEIAPSITGSKEHPSMEELRRLLGEGLERLGLREGRDAFKEIDTTPILRYLFGGEARWRPHQEEIIKKITRGDDLLVIMPTGSGKSACFQIPSILFGELGGHLTVVISPLIALIRNQIQAMREKGIYGVDAIHSELDPEARLRVFRDIRNGWTFLLYLSPEQLLNPVVKDALTERGVRLLVIDECHCLSEWGHDFRPEYRKIPDFLKSLSQERANEKTQVIAFSATATKTIQREITELLNITTPPMDLGIYRQDLSPIIKPVNDNLGLEERIEILKPLLKRHSTRDGVLYVTRRRDTKRAAQILQTSNIYGFPKEAINYLHAGVKNRKEQEESFLRPDRETRLIVATTAFGMGIDKPDIYFIAHLDAPSSVEAYAQEIGRGARDSKIEGESLSMASPKDIELRNWMAQPIHEGTIRMVLTRLRQLEGGKNELYVSPSLLGADINIQESDTRAALFALDTLGILKILSRGRESFLVHMNKDPETSLSSCEEKIIEYIKEREGPVNLRLVELKRDLSPLNLPLEEIERAIRRLLKNGYLREDGTDEVITPITYNKTERREELQRWLTLEEAFAEELTQRFKRERGRWITLTIQDQLNICDQLKISLKELHVILHELRVFGLCYVYHGLFQIRLVLQRWRDLSLTIQEKLRSYESTMKSLERLFIKEEKATLPIERGEEGRERRRLLAGLVARNLIKWECKGIDAGSYRIKFLIEERRDTIELLKLDLKARRQSIHNRQWALQELFSKERGPEEVWDFLNQYFASTTNHPLKEKKREKILKDLTQEQRDAVIAPINDPLLINAGAGTGKTLVLAHRLLYLLAVHNIDPERIIILSFTRSGARSIRERVQRLAKEMQIPAVRSMTFHSFCYNLRRLQGHNERVVGRKRVPKRLQTSNKYYNDMELNEVLVNSYDTLLREEPGASDQEIPAQRIESYSKILDSIRNGHPQLDQIIIHPQDLDQPNTPESLYLPDKERKISSQSVKRVFYGYERELERCQKIDYAGMVSRALQQLRDDDSFRENIQALIAHLLVDEFQDTSRAQEELMRLVIGPHTGLTVVGDNDQTIYSFNGSDVRNILDFQERNKKRWKDKKTHIAPLEENFRSTPNIVEVASQLIAKNRRRLHKKLRPSSIDPSQRIGVFRRRNAVVKLGLVLDAKEALGCAFDTIKEYLKEGVDPDQIAVLSRLNPVNNRKKALLHLLEQALERERIPIARPPETLKKTDHLISSILELGDREPGLELESLVERGHEVTEHWLHRIGARDLEAALIEALDRGIQTLGEWAQDLRDAIQERELDPRSLTREGITLKTIHQAKGEEYEKVILLHLGEGHLPYPKAVDIEEERRILYVGLTRAQEEILITGERGNSFCKDLLEREGEGLKSFTWSGRVPDLFLEESSVTEKDPWKREDLKEKIEKEEKKRAQSLKRDEEYQNIEETQLGGSAFHDWLNDD